MWKLCQIFQNGSYRYYVRDYLGSTRAVLAEDGTLLQDANYYPGGLSFSQLNDTEETDRLHCGKEWVDMEGLGWYDNTARFHDAILCRFTTPDPLAEKYPDLSPYSHCANNPLTYVDPTGMEFSETAEKYATILQMYATALLYINNGLGNNFLNENAVTELTQVVDEINTLRESDQLYDVVEDNSLGNFKGEVRTNTKNGSIELALGDLNVSIDLVAHEFKHLYQFETGLISLTDKGQPRQSYFILDKTDEVAAYNRGAIFGGPQYTITSLPDAYDGFPANDLRITNATEQLINTLNSDTLAPIKSIQDMLIRYANYYHQSFRYDSKTYFYKP